MSLLFGGAFAAGLAACTLAQPDETRSSGWSAVSPTAAYRSNGAEMQRLFDLFSAVVRRVRVEYVEPTVERRLIENAINGMLTGLDPYSTYVNAKSLSDVQVEVRDEFGGLGLVTTWENGAMRVISPVDDTPAFRAGIKAGDLITALDGQTVQGLTPSEALNRMDGPAGTGIRLTIRRTSADRPLNLYMMRRDIIRVQPVRARLDQDVGYIRLSTFSEQTDPALRRAMQLLRQQGGANLRGLVLDLRDNPGGLLDQAVAVASHFLDGGEVVSTRARNPRDNQRWDARTGDISGGVPIVVLTNWGSASASEIVAGALQDHRRAVVVGTRSFGKGSVQTVIPLRGNGVMRLTTARYYTPSGRSIQGLGIAPDIEVQSSRTEQPHFGPEREADLNRALRNQGAPPRNDLPAVARDIPKLPPESFPTFDATKPETDFQLQQAMVVLRGMAQQRRASR